MLCLLIIMLMHGTGYFIHVDWAYMALGIIALAYKIKRRLAGVLAKC